MGLNATHRRFLDTDPVETIGDFIFNGESFDDLLVFWAPKVGLSVDIAGSPDNVTYYDLETGIDGNAETGRHVDVFPKFVRFSFSVATLVHAEGIRNTRAGRQRHATRDYGPVNAGAQVGPIMCDGFIRARLYVEAQAGPTTIEVGHRFSDGSFGSIESYTLTAGGLRAFALQKPFVSDLSIQNTGLNALQQCKLGLQKDVA